MDYEFQALAYHEKSPRGKIATRNTKELNSQEDLSLAYSPGVAGPCRKIADDADRSFQYTARGNLVAVISNGTAVLGLGDIGPYAAKPVMEGKAMLFKKFADIDVFDIEIAEKNPEKFVEIVRSLEPTFGGINLEDIKAPECFYIEEQLRKHMKIPVLHDDQHGTAIIAGAALLNACELTNRDLKNARVVFSGAGAAAISCASLFKTLGVQAENLIMVDSTGVIHSDRNDLNEYKRRFAIKTPLRTLQDALKGADIFIGVSSADIMTGEMLASMAKDPIVFAMANPNPEINPELAFKVRKDVIMATGRSDYPNQVNNVLGFPYIFRGALDVRATEINEAMKLAAVYAIAELAKEDVPEEVMAIYKGANPCRFGRDYLIPKPVDQRVLLRVAPAVAKAAMDSGVAKIKIDIDEYRDRIEKILGPTRRIIRNLKRETSAAAHPVHVVLAGGEDPKVIKAARQALDGGNLKITLLGNEHKIREGFKTLGFEIPAPLAIVDPISSPNKDRYTQTLFELRGRKGVSHSNAAYLIQDADYFGAIMLHLGEADAFINGVTNSYHDAVLPLLKIIRAEEGRTLAGVYMVVKDQSVKFFADCTINIDPNAMELAEIAISASEIAKYYTQDPIRVAMLSFTSFDGGHYPSNKKVADAVSILHKIRPEMEVDGEMQVDVALNSEIRNREYPFCTLKGDANVLIFPDLNAANAAYKLLTNFGAANATGPILVGLKKPAHVMQRGASVSEITDMIHLAAHQASRRLRR